MNLEPVVKLLRERVGLDPDSLGASTLPRVVSSRMGVEGMQDVNEYAQRLTVDLDEFQELVDDLSVPETWFFRGGAVFEYLVTYVREACSSRLPGDPVRILSIPCSSGEEPLSLAISLVEGKVPIDQWSIEGVDISTRQIRLATAGRYRDFSFRQTGKSIQERYFRAVGDQWEIDSAIRARVNFRPANLFDDSFFASERLFDIVLCRNLLIYLHPQARRRALLQLHRLLKPEGLLGVGHAEPLDQKETLFQPTGPAELFLYQRVEPSDTKRIGRKELPISQKHLPQNVEGPRKSAVPVVVNAKRENLPAALPPAIPSSTSLDDHFVTARSLADSGRLDEALAVCRREANKGPHSADMFALMGVIHQSRQEVDDAENCFQRALYLDPNHSEALMHLMLLAQTKGDSSQAERLRRRIQRTSKRGES